MHHRKREHTSNIVCKYFLTNTCRRSSNQGALCWFRHDQHPLSATPGVATSVSPLWNTNFPLLPAMSQSPISGLQQQIVTMMQQQKLQQQQQQQHEKMRMMMTQVMNMNILIQKLITIKNKKSHSYDIDKQCSKQLLDATNVGTKSFPNTRFKKQQ